MARCAAAWLPDVPGKGQKMSEQFDAIVIGAGQAGPALAVRCGKQGLKTALVERHRFGGTCVNNGCVPTKTLDRKSVV